MGRGVCLINVKAEGGCLARIEPSSLVVDLQAHLGGTAGGAAYKHRAIRIIEAGDEANTGIQRLLRDCDEARYVLRTDQVPIDCDLGRGILEYPSTESCGRQRQGQAWGWGLRREDLRWVEHVGPSKSVCRELESSVAGDGDGNPVNYRGSAPLACWKPWTIR